MPSPELPALPDLAPQPSETPIGTEAQTLEPAFPLDAPSPFQRPDSIDVTIASWHQQAREPEKPGAETAAPAPQRQQATWRTSFGSERTTAAWRKVGRVRLDQDIIALQGITSIAAARRNLDARRYHLVASRQLLTRRPLDARGISVFRSDAPPTTALAYRRQRGVRIAGVRHFLPPRAVKDEPPAITAFRLRIHHRMLWVASLDLPAACSTSTAPDACRPHAETLHQFNAWLDQIAKQKALLLLLGSWPPEVERMIADADLQLSHAHAHEALCSHDAGALLAHPPVAGLAATGDRKPDHDITAAAAPAGAPCIAVAKVRLDLR